MTEVERLARDITARLPRIKDGALRFWGQWFGKPYDNWYRLTRCDAEDNLLRMYFNDDETLLVWAPRDASVDEHVFRIGDADCVRWEWFYYGRPKTAATRYFLEFTRTATGIEATNDTDWFNRRLRPDPNQPAVEVLGVDDLRRRPE